MSKYRVIVGNSLITLVTIAGLSIPACRVPNLPLWERPAHVGKFEVERIKDVDYYCCLESDSGRHHQLDLFLPKGQKDFPVVVLVHGGAWMVGDNRCCGLFSSVGEFFARQGIGAVLPNYRQSPTIKHPEHVKDVARAIGWTRKNIADFGGCRDKLFLAGHSAGGHLVALVVTDDRYLKEEGLSSADIKGVITVSGVYHLPAGKMETTLGGVNAAAFRLDEITPLRRAGSHGLLSLTSGIPMKLNVFSPVFGDDPNVREEASPLNHVRPGLPPFLIFSAERDLPTLPGMAEEFHQALLARGCAARLVQIPNRNHNSIIFHATAPDDPVAREMLDFIRGSQTARGVEPDQVGEVDR